MGNRTHLDKNKSLQLYDCNSSSEVVDGVSFLERSYWLDGWSHTWTFSLLGHLKTFLHNDRDINSEEDFAAKIATAARIVKEMSLPITMMAM
ncbi:hypothetical protein AVEN_207469-1 [Araneus ventricosus]|uniref:Uncharacterized protein n=1 Tax=Araneus ventricosus TaxID=182803 RepID=A0A4Y2EED0_ARAVE|nr:hypothetical protein AVEN_207469-1 [Araneus ventricosus]